MSKESKVDKLTKEITKTVLKYYASDATPEEIRNLIINLMLENFDLSEVNKNKIPKGELFGEKYYDRLVTIGGSQLMDVVYRFKNMIELVEQMTPYRLELLCTVQKRNKGKEFVGRLVGIKSVLQSEYVKDDSLLHKPNMDTSALIDELVDVMETLPISPHQMEPKKMTNLITNILLELHRCNKVDVLGEEIQTSLLENTKVLLEGELEVILGRISVILMAIEEITNSYGRMIYRLSTGEKGFESIVIHVDVES